MSDLPVRLALVGDPDVVATRSEMMRRVRGGKVVLTAESIEVALRFADEFDATVVDAPADACLAVESGKHVLVSAPVADSTEQAVSLLNAVEKSGVVFGVSGLPRNAPSNQTFMDRLSSGRLGDAGLLRVHRWSSHEGRTIAETIFGDLDGAIHLFGAKPTVVYAIGTCQNAYLQIHLGFTDGGMAVLDFSNRLPEGQDYASTCLIGSKGAAYADDHHNAQLLLTKTAPTALITESGSGHLYEFQAFVDEIASDSPSLIDGDSVLTVHHVIDAIERSLESTLALQRRGGVYEPA